MTDMLFGYIVLVVIVGNSGIHASTGKTRIISIAAAPYIARIDSTFPNDTVPKFVTTAVIIDSTHILTAAHPFEIIRTDDSDGGEILDGIHVAVGLSSYRDNSERHKVDNVIIHPNYTRDDQGRVKNDIAIIKLTKAIPWGPDQKPATVSAVDPRPGSYGELIGWKYMPSPTGSTVALRRSSKLRIYNSRICRSTFPLYWFSPDSMCFLTKHRSTSCPAHNGGVFVVDGKLVAVLSWKSGCTRRSPLILSSLVSVSQHIDWIKMVQTNKFISLGPIVKDAPKVPPCEPLPQQLPAPTRPEMERSFWPPQWKLRSDRSRIELAVRPYPGP